MHSICRVSLSSLWVPGFPRDSGGLRHRKPVESWGRAAGEPADGASGATGVSISQRTGHTEGPLSRSDQRISMAPQPVDWVTSPSSSIGPGREEVRREMVTPSLPL